MQLSFRQRVRLHFKLFVLSFTKGWSWDHVKRVNYSIFQDVDTSIIRSLLAAASLIWAVFVWVDPAVFNRPAYEIMRVVAPGWVWALGFFIHFLGVFWRTYDPIPRVMPGLIINGYGFLIWFFSTVSLNYYVRGLSPGTAAELTLCAASAWALYKTGFKKELISV